MSDTPIRLVLADDHPIVLHGLQQLFERTPGFAVAASCRDGRQTLEAVRSLRPDVLVLDLRMPGMSGLDVLRAVAEEKLPCRVVLLTAALRDAEVSEAMRLGVMGIVMKESPPDALVDAVRRVHGGEQWIDRDPLMRAFGRVARAGEGAPGGATLTAREREIVQMVSEGLRNRDIAERMKISEGTVKVHLHNVYEKLGVDGRLELVLFAQQKGLV